MYGQVEKENRYLALNLSTGNLLLSNLTPPAGYLFLISPARYPFSDIVDVWAGRTGESVAST